MRMTFTSNEVPVQAAIGKYAIAEHLNFGQMYAFEVDGYGNQLFMDDANVPSLLSLPYLGAVRPDDPIYLNTRRFVLSESNPYFFRGKVAEGIGGPHVGKDMIWPLAIKQWRENLRKRRERKGQSSTA